MRKKIVISISAIIILSLIIMTGLYFGISNYRYIQNSKSVLLEYDKILEVLIDNNISLNDELSFLKNSNVRVTYISANDIVLFDSYKDSNKDTHADAIEVEEAMKNGYGSSIRYSNEVNKEMVYYALKLSNGSVIRTSMPLDSAIIFKDINIGYYLIALLISILIAVLLSIRITKVILNPLKELENTTSKIANGELSKRVSIKTIDEFGMLGKSFNNMADRLEESISESLDKQNKLEAILKSMDSGVVAVDSELKVIMINPYAKKIFGVRGDIIGKKFSRYIMEYNILNVLKNSEDRVEVLIRYPEVRNLKIRTANIINGEDKIGTVAVVQDITDIKRLENMRSQFVANISHELKTPLTSIKGFAETLRYVDDDETRNKFLDIIDEESDRLARLIGDILILYDIEQNRDPVYEPFSTKDIIQNVELLVMREAKNKNISISVDAEDDIELIGDRDKFKQMLINLVYNAVKYTEPNGSVMVSSFKDKRDFVLTVKDTGIGISKEDLPRIFERFYRVDKARSRNSGGTGLGLAIVKHIAISFNGVIDVKSTLGKGTTFIIKIPISRDFT